MANLDLPPWLTLDRDHGDDFRRGIDGTGQRWLAHRSQQYWWSDAAPNRIRCECGSSQFEIDFGVLKGLRAICNKCERVHLVTEDSGKRPLQRDV